MKKIFAFLICILICPLFVIGVCADDLPLVIDNADLLSRSEEETLSGRLREISDELSCDIVVVTEKTVIGYVESYAEDYFDSKGYGRGGAADGILLLFSVEDEAWCVTGSGICDNGFDDALDYICEDIPDHLREEEYKQCFETFAERSYTAISTVRSGDEFKRPYDLIFCAVMSLIIGFVLAFIVTAVMKGQLNTVRAKAAAGDYLKRDSLTLTDSRDMFLYRSVNRVKKVKNEGGSHRSFSGRSHNSRSGRL